jgi:ferritin
MLKKIITDSLNEQINKEVYSAYLYQSMAAYSSSLGLNGFANWFSIQVQEELLHAKMFYDYIIQHGERVVLKAIEQPQSEFESAKGLFAKTLEHEQFVTSLIHKLLRLAKDENDSATEIFLQWFVSEQVEEEANASEILQKLTLIKEDMSGLLFLDGELAKRVFVAPTVK